MSKRGVKQLKIEVDGLVFDSTIEKFFYYYLKELEAAGYIESFVYHPDSVVLSHPISKEVQIAMKTKTKPVSIPMTNGKGHVYTWDFTVTWDDSAYEFLVWQEGGTYDHRPDTFSPTKPHLYRPFFAENGVSYIDTKGAFSGRNNNSAATFPLNQHWIFDSYSIFVQKVVISLCGKGLFPKTFTPHQVIIDEVYKKDYRNKTSKELYKQGDSKLKYTPVLLQHYQKQFKITI